MLSDIESDIDGDWENIQKKIKTKEISNYNSIFEKSNNSIFEKEIWEMFSRRKNLNEKEIWKMFCSAKGYDFTEAECSRCYTLNMIFCQGKRRKYNYEEGYLYINYKEGYEKYIEERKQIFCPNCGHGLLIMAGYDLLGIIQISKQERKREERRYDFRQEFRNNI